MKPWFNLKAPEIIAKENPFPKLKLKVIDFLGDENGHTGQVFKVQDATGKLYKLRKCLSGDEAKKYETYVKHVPGLTPHYYGRDNNYLLFEFFPGKLLDNKNLDDCHAMGRLYAEMHQLHNGDDIEIQHKTFYAALDYLLQQKILTPEEYTQSKILYDELAKSVVHHIALEAFDLNATNFMRSEDRVLYIDEEGMRITFKGSGMLRIFERLSGEHLDAFKKGYASVASMKFFTPDYELLMMLYTSIMLLEEWSSKGVPRERWDTRILVPLRTLLKTRKNPYRK